MKHQEIERKWLIDAFPEGMELTGEMRTSQGYLAFEPNTVRIRKREWPGGCDHRLTVKGEGTLQRTEVEFEIDAERYESLVGLLIGPAVTKLYRTYALPGGLTLECSLVDEGEPESFMYAEVEFDCVEAAKSFVPPACLGEEKTEDPAFTMAAYCARKLARQRGGS